MGDDIDSMVFYDDGDDCDDHEQYQDSDYDYEHDEEEKESLMELFQYCLGPTLYDAASYILPLLLASLAFKLFAQSQYTPYRVFHCLSVIIGICIIQYYVFECLHLLIVLAVSSYAFLYIPKKYHKGIGAFLPSLLIILYCELWMKPIIWHKVRSVMMVSMMKAISIAIDKMDSNDLPDLYEYLGYMFCAVTCLFGPWVPFKDYVALHRRDRRSIWWIPVTIGYLLLAFIFLSVSNCWTQWMLSNNAEKWLSAYRDALAYRMSHYFISYVASAILLLEGYPISSATITKPWQIEVPRSLVQVVICWNIPMHSWLKIYVFRPSTKHLGKFGAVIITYLMSSLLHGLNFQLAAVLLTLGLYTYVEFQLRAMLAFVFDACIAAKRCDDHKCTHGRTSRNCWWVIVTNLAFSALSVFHLTYLGVMFDTSELQETGYSYAHTIQKWSQLSFASHWVALATYCIYFLIR